MWFAIVPPVRRTSFPSIHTFYLELDLDSDELAGTRVEPVS